MAQSHSYARVHSGPLSESRSALCGRHLVGLFSCYRLNIRPSPFVLVVIYKTEYSFYCPTEGERLSGPSHCSKCAFRAPSCVSLCFSLKNTETVCSMVQTWDHSRQSGVLTTRSVLGLLVGLLRKSCHGCFAGLPIRTCVCHQKRQKKQSKDQWRRH